MKDAGAGLLPPKRGSCSGVRTAIAGPMRLKVVNKPQNVFILHSSTLRAKERPQTTYWPFFTILKDKDWLPRFGITNLDRLPHCGMIMGSVAISGIIIESDTTFRVDTLVDRFLGRNLPPPNNDVHNQQIVDLRKASICELNTKLMNLEGVLQMEKNRGESLREIRKRADGVWWESPMEELNLFQLQHLKKALEILKKKVEKEAQMVNNNAFPFLGSAWTPPNCAS
uniref:Mads box protein n=1 Tax=Solanum tuberosum TaxID=4113 RepID=M1DPU0_SOLTU